MSKPVKCIQRTTAGRKCRAWSIRGSDPPTCSPHAKRKSSAGAPGGNSNSAKHGFYGSTFEPGEIADLIALAADDGLDDEIAAARVAVRRVMNKLMVLDDYHRGTKSNAHLVFVGVNTVARLIRTRRLLTGESADNIVGALATALDELGAQWDIEL